MKSLSKAVAVASLLSAGVMSANMANAEVAFNASVVSDYVFRGFSYSDSSPALQVGADYSHDSGAYLGTWLSNTDDGTDTGVEYDIYAGYWMEAGEMEIDLAVNTYSYSDGGYDTTEVSAIVTQGALSASVYLDVDAYSTTHLSASYAIELPSDLALDLGVGYLVDANDTFEDDVIDMSASISKGFDVIDVALTVTNIDYDFAEDDTLVFLTASKEF